MDTVKLHSITYSEEGRKIDYEYSVGSNIQKLFVEKEPFYSKYQIDVSATPISIAVIPFLSNILPRDPANSFEGKLVAKKLVKNTLDGSKSSMLFSGGVDAYATYIRIYDRTPDLITLHGADITIKDKDQWKDFTGFIESEELLNDNNKEYIETNLRDFYTYQVELLLKDIGWWGKVQHGLALVGSIAPLSYINNYGSVHIASSYTDHIDIDWGSTPEIDEKITWGSGFKVFHDGYELKRQDKVDLIAKFASEKNKRFRLRVCYSEKRTEFNCSYCEKCFRTILGLILNNQNPNEYGFKVDGSVYDKIYQILHIGSGSKGVKYFWWELMEKAKSVETFFVFEDVETETKHMNDFRNGKVDRLLEEKINNASKGTNRLKFIIRNKFPWLQTIYRKFK